MTTGSDSQNTPNDKAFGVKTISSQLNLKEYFASKHQNNVANPRKKSKLMPCMEESVNDLECRPVSFRLGDDDESDSNTDKSKGSNKNRKDCNDNTNKIKKTSKKKKQKEKKKAKKLKKSSK